MAAALNPAGLNFALDRAVERSHRSTWMIGAMGRMRVSPQQKLRLRSSLPRYRPFTERQEACEQSRLCVGRICRHKDMAFSRKRC